MAHSPSPGVTVRKVGNYFIKEVDQNAGPLTRWYGARSLKVQSEALTKLGDMAPSHLLKNGKLITRDAGAYTPGNFWSTWAKGSWRLGTPVNDIRPRNIGANGISDSSGRIRYIGRGDAPERLLAHAKPGSGKEDLVGEVLFNNNLPAAQAQSLEQELMQMLGGPKSVNPSTSLRNKIQGIGEGNPNFIDLEFAADDALVIEALRRAGLLGR